MSQSAHKNPISKFKIPGLVAIIVLAGFAAFVFNRRSSATRDFPGLAPVLDQFAAPGIELARPATCIECHREATEKWMQSHHSKANAPFTEADRERLLTQRTELLDQRKMNWVEKRETMVLQEPGVPDSPVVGTIGITPLIQYLLLAPDGRIQTHDVAWDVEKKEWFSVFEDEQEETPRFAGEWGHWSGQGMNWDANCAYCHMTAYEKKYDTLTNTYGRTWDHMTITCTECHPSMHTHMDQVQNGNNYWKEELTPKQVMETCAICHSRRDQLTADRFVAGDLYEDHFYLTTLDTPGIYHPDGQVIGENYVYGSLTMSRMGTAGVTCMDCHDPHTADFILPIDHNALCQRCHGSGLKDAPKIDPLQHSHHPADSTGNLCIECHMPSTEFMGRDPRRDHSFSHPDPRLTIEMGIPNACSKCHNTQSDKWSMDYAEKWYGPDMNAERRQKAYLMRDLFAMEETAPQRLKEAVLVEKNRMWKATFVSMFQYVPFDEEAFNILVAMLDDPEPMVRSASIRILGVNNIAPEKALSLLEDPVRGVRLSAALTVPGMTGLSESVDKELLEYMNH
ncbi:MAG TPA: cytochrome c3 family protein, partial [Oceanipulchritudo sp.]|nr:cytochrome c3 family protein [Oceanipulchritudo sp.]